MSAGIILIRVFSLPMVKKAAERRARLAQPVGLNGSKLGRYATVIGP